jgi:hypothetical protein
VMVVMAKLPHSSGFYKSPCLRPAIAASIFNILVLEIIQHKELNFHNLHIQVSQDSNTAINTQEQGILWKFECETGCINKSVVICVKKGCA